MTLKRYVNQEFITSSNTLTINESVFVEGKKASGYESEPLVIDLNMEI